MSTWDRILESGVGTVDYRLMVEGWPHEWVTHRRITHATNADGRVVYPGLSYTGLTISEQTVLRDAWPTVRGMTLTIAPSDGDEDTVSSFSRDARAFATLVSPLLAGDGEWVTIPVGLPTGMYHTATEAIFANVHSPPSAQQIFRGRWDTEAQDHPLTDINIDYPVPIYEFPPTMEGRRAYLYAYGVGDDPAGDGHIIWRGVIVRPPRMNGNDASWSIEMAPITTVFDQNVGGAASTEYRVRGIYHSNSCPLALRYGVSSGSDIDWSDPTYASGFFETQEEWVQYVNGKIAALVATHSTDLTKLKYGFIDGSYNVRVGDMGSDPDLHAAVLISDALDGDMPINAQGNYRVFKSGSLDRAVAGGDSSGQLVVLGTTYQPPYGYPLPQARCMVGAPIFNATMVFTRGGWVPDDSLNGTPYPGPADGSWPNNRIYLNTVAGLEIGMTLCAKTDESSAFMEITALDNADGENWVEVELQNSQTGPLYISSDTSLVPAGIYGINTDWSGFVADVVSQAPRANTGRTPYITANDVNTSQLSAYWVTYPFNAYWRTRKYRFSHPTKVRDVLAPELMVTGFMARVGSDGRLEVTPMPLVSAQRSAQHTITDADILYPADGMFGMWPTWELQKDGIVNVVNLRLGYDPVQDEYDEGQDFIVRMQSSIAEHKSADRAKREISIKSTPGAYAARRAAVLAAVAAARGQKAQVSAVPNPEVVAGFALQYLQTLSQDYAIVTIAVPFTKFNVLCGDIVSVTSSFIPNGFGGRGIDSKKGVCVGREWNLDPKSNRMGVLTIWFPRDTGRTAGYCPTGRITGQSNTSGDTWVLTLDDGDANNIAYSEDADGNVTRHFAIGDYIEVRQVNSDAPTVINGIVSDKPAPDQIEVELDSAWTPSTLTWELEFGYDGSNTTDRQQAYCWVADADGRLLNGGAGRAFV